jgi:hypothetical protein
MNQNTKKRAVMKNKISRALSEDLKCLPVGMRNIFLDDLITAFESRLLVLNKVQSNLQFAIDVEVQVAQ